MTEQSEQESFLDKAFNQIKGLIYGYVIGSLGSLGKNEQGLVSDLTKLKNTIGGVHTDIALTEQYSNFWLIDVKKQIKDCSKRYFDLFNQNSTVFDTLILRLQEVDNLNKMRCDEISKEEIESLKISINALLSFPEGRLGNYSEENILNVLIEIGKHLAEDSEAKVVLKDYPQMSIMNIPDNSFGYAHKFYVSNSVDSFVSLGRQLPYSRNAQ